MKTKLFLIATLFITAITFSQTTKKGYDYYKAKSDEANNQKMNKAELIDAMAKDAGFSKADAGKALNPSISKRAARTGRNPQTGATIKAVENTKDLNHRKRPGRVKYSNITLERGHLDEDSDDDGILDGDDLHIRKRPGRTKYGTIISTEGQTHRGQTKSNTSKNSSVGQNLRNGDDLILRKRPGRKSQNGAANKNKKVAKFKAGKALADQVKNH